MLLSGILPLDWSILVVGSGSATLYGNMSPGKGHSQACGCVIVDRNFAHDALYLLLKSRNPKAPDASQQCFSMPCHRWPFCPLLAKRTDSTPDSKAE